MSEEEDIKKQQNESDKSPPDLCDVNDPSTDNTSTGQTNNNSNDALLAKIAELEKQNEDLIKERDNFKNSIVINTSDVYANLQQLQANFAEKVSNGYEAMRSAVPESGDFGFDLIP